MRKKGRRWGGHGYIRRPKGRVQRHCTCGPRPSRLARAPRAAGPGRAVKEQGAASGSPPLTHSTTNKGAKGYFRATKYANTGAARGPMGGDQRRLRRRPLSTIGSLPPPMGERPRQGRGLPRRWVRVWLLRGGGSARSSALGRFSAPSAVAPPAPPLRSSRCVRSPSVGTEHPRARAFLARHSQAPRVDAAGWTGFQGGQRSTRTFPSVRFEGLARSARSWRKETNHPIFSVPGHHV